MPTGVAVAPAVLWRLHPASRQSLQMLPSHSHSSCEQTALSVMSRQLATRKDGVTGGRMKVLRLPPAGGAAEHAGTPAGGSRLSSQVLSRHTRPAQLVAAVPSALCARAKGVARRLLSLVRAQECFAAREVNAGAALAAAALLQAASARAAVGGNAGFGQVVHGSAVKAGGWGKRQGA